ncbi:tail fiber protein [Flavobacterium piscis]|uniref:Microcystin-dependent protein n=1 Tax=Flavobacterium piscis TaxID=1114874 RepID=A0ABU1YEW5_9FLAO|nr:tail fiber protein [Flavobacterium piscis]MDR7212643.1 microcystin-dependent protein [Flavobacterium piscis]
MEGTMAVITTVAYDFTPKYWAQCNGQLLAINTNQALFSLLGTTYGGNGIQTFALPDLRSRTAVGTGVSSTGTSYQLGEANGSTTAIMGISNMPAHNHNGAINLSLGANDTPGFDSNAEGNNIGSGIANTFSSNSNTPMANPLSIHGTVGVVGGSQPFSILSPYLAINYVICIYGIFPSRN